MVEIAFVCGYCEELLAREADADGWVRHDEFHPCIGETVGNIAKISGDRVFTVSDDFKIVME